MLPERGTQIIGSHLFGLAFAFLFSFQSFASEFNSYNLSSPKDPNNKSQLFIPYIYISPVYLFNLGKASKEKESSSPNRPEPRRYSAGLKLGYFTFLPDSERLKNLFSLNFRISDKNRESLSILMVKSLGLNDDHKLDIRFKRSKNIFRYYGFGDNYKDESFIKDRYEENRLSFTLRNLISKPFYLESFFALNQFYLAPQIEERLEKSGEGLFIFNKRVLKTGAGLLLDKLNRRVNPRDGYYARILLEDSFIDTAHRWAAKFEAGLFKELSFRSRLINKFLVHLNEKESFFTELPSLSPKSFIRGLPRNRYLGNFSISSSNEYRYSLVKDLFFLNKIEIELIPFLDVGMVGESLNKSTESLNAGFGLSVISRSLLSNSYFYNYNFETKEHFVFLGLESSI